MKPTQSNAHPRMTADEMVRLIDACPPGGWPDGWAGWDNTRDAQLQMVERCMANVPTYPAERYHGRGIVVSVNAKPGQSSGKTLSHGYFPGAWVLVQELRRLGCTLPICFAYMGPLEWDPVLTRLMAGYGVTCMDLCAVEKLYPTRILAGFESKCFSILHAPFREVLYLDADNVPVQDPTFLFETTQYRYHGAIFWPDFPPYDRAEWLPEVVWNNLGMPYRDEVDFESGQLVIDKERCWNELCLTQHLNEHSDYYYKFVFGDKSTFHLAWAKWGSNWAIPKKAAGWNHKAILQYDFSGNLLFQHCTQDKPGLSGYHFRSYLVHEAECHQHLDELRRLWHGKLWNNMEPTAAELALRQRLEGQVFWYERNKLDGRQLRLLVDGRIGRGLAKLEVSWDVFIDEQGPIMVIRSIEDVPTMALRPDGSGGWQGYWLVHERCEVRLVPVERAAEAAA